MRMHTDTEFITIMSVDSPGLEILDRRDPTLWHALPPRPEAAKTAEAATATTTTTNTKEAARIPDDALIVIFGDTFEALTNDQVRATCHRVRLPSPGDGPRTSLVHFVTLDDLAEPPAAFGPRARSSRALRGWWKMAAAVSGALL